MTEQQRLIKFMEHGLCIWSQGNSRFTVQKIATYNSPTCVLCRNITPDCSVKEFPHYAAAYDFCLKFCEDGVEVASLTECHVQLAYNPTGFALKVKNLDKVKAASPEEAHDLGMELVVAFFKEEGITKKVGDNFELKVLPVRP